MCFKKSTKPEPVIDLTTISRRDYLDVMVAAGISSMAVLDSNLTITTVAELDRIAPYLVYPADFYIAQIFDCEDYGIMAQGDAAHIFHVSGIRLGIGTMPLGTHGFVLTMDTSHTIWWLEPNAGFPYAGVWYKIGERDYIPKKVFA